MTYLALSCRIDALYNCHYRALLWANEPLVYSHSVLSGSLSVQ